MLASFGDTTPQWRSRRVEITCVLSNGFVMWSWQLNLARVAHESESMLFTLKQALKLTLDQRLEPPRIT